MLTGVLLFAGHVTDMTIFAVGLACSFGAGALLQVLGWQTLNLVLLPWMAAAALALLWLGWKRGKTAKAVPAVEEGKALRGEMAGTFTKNLLLKDKKATVSER
jgi:hypothetical protein